MSYNFQVSEISGMQGLLTPCRLVTLAVILNSGERSGLCFGVTVILIDVVVTIFVVVTVVFDDVVVIIIVAGVVIIIMIVVVAVVFIIVVGVVAVVVTVVFNYVPLKIYNSYCFPILHKNP
jgi:hypothetical protein